MQSEIIVTKIKQLNEQVSRTLNTLLTRTSASNDRQMIGKMIEEIDRRGQLLSQLKECDQEFYGHLVREIADGANQKC